MMPFKIFIRKVCSFFSLLKHPKKIFWDIAMRHSLWCQTREIRYLLDPKTAVKLAKRDHYHCIDLVTQNPSKNGINLLEVGCGNGRYVALLSSLGFNITGIDPYSFPQWEIIKQSTSAQFISGMHAECLKFRDNTFDKAVCIGALLFFQDPIRALQEIRRVVKPGGTVLITGINKLSKHDAARRSHHEPGRFKVFTPEEFTQILVQCGFKVDKTFLFGYSPTKFLRLWSYLHYAWIPIWLNEFLSRNIEESKRTTIVSIATVTK